MSHFPSLEEFDQGQVDAILTEDTSIRTFGTPTTEADFLAREQAILGEDFSNSADAIPDMLDDFQEMDEPDVLGEEQPAGSGMVRMLFFGECSLSLDINMLLRRNQEEETVDWQ